MTKRSNVSAIAAQLLCGILFQINYARAEKPPSPQVVGFAGTCDELTVAGTAEECVGKLSYMNLRNGTVVLSIETKKGYMVSFVGEKDSQPRPEEYHLYISRVRMFTKATESVASAAGQCVVSMSRDGTIWSEIKCQATDADRASYDMTFRPDKKPIFSNLERVSSSVMNDISKRFKNKINESGMRGVNKDVQMCYDTSDAGDINSIRKCMLYDIASYKLATVTGKIWEARGLQNPNHGNTYVTDHAFTLRMKIYSQMAFGGGPDRAYQFFEDSPDKVLDGVTK